MSVEEIDFFDPWRLTAAGPEPEASPSPTSPTRWRTRRPVVPVRSRRVATRPLATRSDPDPDVARRDLSPAMRLYGRAFERLRIIAARLSAADHEATVFGGQHESPARLELRLRPSRGPVAPSGRASSIIFEFRPEAMVVLRTHGDADDAASEMSRQGYSVVDPAWIEARTLDFVEGALLAL